jgi:hypothetical protein
LGSILGKEGDNQDERKNDEEEEQGRKAAQET